MPAAAEAEAWRVDINIYLFLEENIDTGAHELNYCFHFKFPWRR